MATIRKKMIEELTVAPDSTVKSLYKLYSMVKEQNDHSINWDDLSSSQKNKINIGIKQLDEGKGIKADKAIQQLQKKYGIN